MRAASLPHQPSRDQNRPAYADDDHDHDQRYP
jgi:hypothetical protein